MIDFRRTLEKELLNWKNRPGRQPLIVRGARQVGKTHLLKEFGKNHFEDCACFNFEKTDEIKDVFQKTKDISRILQELSVIRHRSITSNTLLIFDEIQECKEALNALKYFHEDAPEYPVVAAGSLLGVALKENKQGFPVGQVEFLNLYPLNFLEYLWTADSKLYQFVQNISSAETIPLLLFNTLREKFSQYSICGGMPAVAATMISQIDIENTERKLNNVRESFILDFSKHSKPSDVAKINHVWNSIPSQLARENKKFLYQVVKPGARAREFENALEWLELSGLVTKVYRTKAPRIPLGHYDDLSSFKLYLVDIGVLRSQSRIDPSVLIHPNDLYTEFKGAFSENYVLQSLLSQFDPPRYWTSLSDAEIDFLIQYKNAIIPIEVKSSESVQNKSLTYYRKDLSPSLSIRYSWKNLEYNDGLLNIPFFLADKTRDLVGKYV